MSTLFRRDFKLKDMAYMVLIVVFSTIGAYLLPVAMPFMQLMENWTVDARISALSAPQPQSEDIVIVTITEDTLATLPYRAPLDRAFLAGVLRHLDDTGVRAIGLDILLDQPTEPAKDEALSHALRNLNAPLITAVANQDAGLTPSQAQFLDSYTEGLGHGYANFVRDRIDGVVRWIYPGQRRDGQWTPGLVAGLAAALGQEPLTETVKLAYRSPPDEQTPAFRSYPAHMVGVLPKVWFKDRIVLIGADMPLDDRHRTPFATQLGRGGVIPGVVIHAHALSQLLDGRVFPELETATVILLAACTAMLGMFLALIGLGLVAKAAVFVLSIVGYGFVAGLVWNQGGAMLPFVVPVLGVSLSMSGGIAYFGQRDREQKRFIREAFSHYLAPALVEQLINDPSLLKVGGERRELTYIFTDIASFTSLTERSDPAQLVPMLNEYIDAMCQIAFAHGATLDKIIGDATVCFFNAPIDQSDHPSRAVACALAMDTYAQKFVHDRASEGVEVGITRIGVHTGTATIGNFGGDAFFDYTAFGDMVNTSARLESVNKHLGTRVCISEATASRCSDVAFRPVGVLVLKGKSEGLKVFEPLSTARANAPATEAYEKAYRLMCDEDADAEAVFRAVLELDPDDPLAKLHLGRLQNGEKSDMIVMQEK